MNRPKRAVSWLYRPSAALGVFLTASFSLIVRGDTTANWTRFLHHGLLPPGVPLVLAYVKEDNYTLSAVGWYRYTEGRDPIVLHGKKEPDDMFRPVVHYEVGLEGKTKWKRIHAEAEQPRSETITVSPEQPIATVIVKMEPFRKWLGIYRYGRLLLENGDAAIFEIDDLLPERDANHDTDFKEDFLPGDAAEDRQGFGATWVSERAHLISLTSVGDRLIAELLFIASSSEDVNLEGTRTLDGDFWPKVTFQVANADRRWKTIGQSQHSGTATSLLIPSGKAERIRVLLTDYKPLVGKFKYGRIVFSNAEAAVFSIDLLVPNK